MSGGRPQVMRASAWVRTGRQALPAVPSVVIQLDVDLSSGCFYVAQAFTPGKGSTNRFVIAPFNGASLLALAPKGADDGFLGAESQA